ncbi:biotin transporter BioY [Paenarthrobacter nicotinovorans]|uniref:biotin transporter BioY n=1 Tax=Paenarthrobacter nicotinovorans TaxID=29320 RepID=UPI0011A6AC13|nr:biotin transporter BioY [Paenarthrobacter nicotinovorans]
MSKTDPAAASATSANVTVQRPAATRKRWNATDLGLIAVFAALVAASSIVPGIPVGALGVPITLATLTVMLSGLVLGAGRGFAAVGLYVLLGLAGLPIFSGGRSGLGILAGPSAGYIIAFPLAAAAVGYLAGVVIRRTVKYRGLWLFAAAMASSIVIVHGLGIVGMMVNAKLDFGKALLADLPFLPGDTLKNVLAVVIALAIHKAFPDVLVRRVKKGS